MKTTSKKSIQNNKGSTLIGAILAIMAFSVVGLSLVQVVADEGANTTSSMNSSHALYVGHAGLEYTKMMLYKGQDPTVTNYPFASGSFSVTTNYSTQLATVVSQVGSATKSQTITANFAANCVAFNTSSAYVSGKNLEDVKLVKSCNQTATIAKMWISGGGVIKHIGIEGTAIYNPGNGIGSPGGGGANDGQEIDVVNYDLSSDTTYTFVGPPQPIRFNTNQSSGTTYTITIEFSDESQITTTFTV